MKFDCHTWENRKAVKYCPNRETLKLIWKPTFKDKSSTEASSAEAFSVRYLLWYGNQIIKMFRKFSKSSTPV